MLSSPADARPRSRPARELADIRGKNSLQALPVRRVGSRKIRPQRTKLSAESGVLPFGARPARSAGWTFGNDIRTAQLGPVSRRPVGGSTGWDPASYNVNRGRAPVHEQLLAKHAGATADDDDEPSGPWGGPGSTGDSEALGFEEGSLEARLEQAGTEADAEAAHAELARAVSRRSARSRGSRRRKGRAGSPSKLKREPSVRAMHTTQVVDLKLDPTSREATPQASLWDAPSPMRVPAPSSRLYTGTIHTHKWASATAPTTRHTPSPERTATRRPLSPSSAQAQRWRAKQEHRHRQTHDTPSGRRSAKFGRATPSMDDADDGYHPTATPARFVDATGDNPPASTVQVVSAVGVSTQQEQPVAIVASSGSSGSHTTKAQAATTTAGQSVVPSGDESGCVVATHSTAGAAGATFVVDKRPPQKHTWFKPSKEDLVDREPPPPLLLWPGRYRVQRLNLITDGDVTGSGKSPLHLAALLGRADLVKRFLTNHDAAAIVDCRDDDNNTSLHLISATTHDTAVEIVNLLADAGADLNAKNNLGWQALHYAAGAGHVELMEVLLKRGSDVNGGTNNKTTALALCCMSGNEDAVRLLVRYRADIFVRDHMVRTPVYFAAVSAHDNLADTLQATQRKRLATRRSDKQRRRMRRDLVRLGFHDRLPKQRTHAQPTKTMIRHIWSDGMRPQSVATARPSTSASHGRRGPIASPMTTTRGSLPPFTGDTEQGLEGLVMSLDFGGAMSGRASDGRHSRSGRSSFPDVLGRANVVTAGSEESGSSPSGEDDGAMPQLRRSASSRSAPGGNVDRTRRQGPGKPGLLDEELELALHAVGTDLLDLSVRTARSAS